MDNLTPTMQLKFIGGKLYQLFVNAVKPYAEGSAVWRLVPSEA